MIALTFILRRCVMLVLVLVAVSVLTFGIVNVLPGDVATAVLGDMASPEMVEAVRERMGLDRPLDARYLEWVGGVLHGDFGRSLQHGQPIAPMLLGRLGNSAILGLITLGIAAPLSIALGVLAALRPGHLLDRAISSFAVGAHAMPEYVIGLLAILCFSIWLPLLPGSSLMDPNENPLNRPEALVLPVGVLVIGMLAVISQVTRAGMIQALGSPYVRTATLKGLPRWKVVLKHALPNVLPPTVTEIGMYCGYVIGGLVVVETLFSYAGLGQMMTNAVSYRDIPTIQAGVLVVAAAYGIGNLLADVAALLLNPRLRG
ncbi:peptide/nickel transport system permease protein [Humitalea rosea]|uniref:Peptide/nickel transport system permease protein n=1 Tax=Humitalea rosea TaxID=990373 RepID=A0A2W7IG01_9PROT|nr:ABC transporter permease [Humitalea rosea]PZW37693.1 peptide/nickel transport system permease protein [Humitalea rosea]